MHLAVVILLALPKVAYAYLDPGTGSYFFQIFLAAILGGLYAFKQYVKKAIDFVKRLFEKK